ncbi:hypothetical protein [Thiohalorhabdus methylotrophus]|uniref:Uncharacterized protein n=1 Tax=Thiohalorhabdus methylotrophus TaxID=3242694 RepID=A0ABV4TZR9_9GAMM
MDGMDDNIREIAPTVVPTFEVVIDPEASPEIREICETYWDYAEESGAGGTPLGEDFLCSEQEVLERFRDRVSESELRDLVAQYSRGVLRVDCYSCQAPIEAPGYSRGGVEQALTELGRGIRGLGAGPEERAQLAEERQTSGARDPRRSVLCPSCLVRYQETDIAYLTERRMEEPNIPVEPGEEGGGNGGIPAPEEPVPGTPEEAPDSAYRILQAPVDRPEQLEEQMAGLVAKGFKPCGGLQVATMGSRCVLIQAAYRPSVQGRAD